MKERAMMPGGSKIVPAYAMTRRRLLLVNCGLCLLIVGSLYDMVTGGEHWPFSSYPMYSRLELDRTVTRLHLFGIPLGLETTEMPLRDFQYLQPFDKTRLHAAFRKLSLRPQASTLLQTAVKDCLRRYEFLRRTGRHQGPPLQALRLYRLHWDLDPSVRNLPYPVERELLIEVAAAD